MTQFTRRNDLPASYEETRRLQDRPATEAVPAALAAYDEPRPPQKTVVRIDRTAVSAADVPAEVEGLAPAWVDLAFAPKQARRASGRGTC